MRIGSPIIPKSSAAVQSVKKRHKDKEDKQEERAPSHSEYLELSDTALLLNKLLYATSNQFLPYPFYFVDAAARNTKQACTITKKIQSQAESMGVSFHYTMVYDMVVNLAAQSHHIIWTTTTAEHETLNSNEKALFEELHNTCLQNQTAAHIIESAALKYVQFKQTQSTTLPSKRECASIIIDSLKGESTLNHNEVKKSLSAVIKQYIIQTQQLEPS